LFPLKQHAIQRLPQYLGLKEYKSKDKNVSFSTPALNLSGQSRKRGELDRTHTVNI
jgi:hypothetical protein